MAVIKILKVETDICQQNLLEAVLVTKNMVNNTNINTDSKITTITVSKYIRLTTITLSE